MRILRFVISALVILMIGMPATASGEENLFDTETAAVHRDKGIALLTAKNYQGAIAELEESVSIAPNAEAYYYLGYAYYYRGRAGDVESRKKSIECFDRAYELDSSYTPNRDKNLEISPSGQNEPSHPSSAAEVSPSQ
jgi:tetratricopeptide (TPR) repeat protein